MQKEYVLSHIFSAANIYLYLIPQPLSVPKLLFGVPEATTEKQQLYFQAGATVYFGY